MVGVVVSLGLACAAAAEQCPPVGVACASIGCKGEVGGYCCCKPYCAKQPNGSISCGCNNFCPASCSQPCAGSSACERGGACYVGRAREEQLSSTVQLTPEAVEEANKQPYGLLVTSALSAFTGTFQVPIPTGTWTSGGTVDRLTLPGQHRRQPRYVPFRALWTNNGDHVIADVVFEGKAAPAPVSLRLDLDGTLTPSPLDAEGVTRVLTTRVAGPN
jgi:hypothetical protein